MDFKTHIIFNYRGHTKNGRRTKSEKPYFYRIQITSVDVFYDFSGVDDFDRGKGLKPAAVSVLTGFVLAVGLSHYVTAAQRTGRERDLLIRTRAFRRVKRTNNGRSTYLVGLDLRFVPFGMPHHV